MEKQYYYRPIKFYGGKVFKCAGFGAENPEHRKFYVDYFKKNGDQDKGLLPGCIILTKYFGDRVEKKDGQYLEFNG
jgi:hypothetical protein